MQGPKNQFTNFHTNQNRDNQQQSANFCYPGNFFVNNHQRSSLRQPGFPPNTSLNTKRTTPAQGIQIQYLLEEGDRYYNEGCSKKVLEEEDKKKKTELFEKALKCYEQILQLQPDVSADLFCRVGDVLDELNRFQDALVNYQKGINKDPKHFFCLTNKSVVLHKLERHQEAIIGYQKAIESCREAINGYQKVIEGCQKSINDHQNIMINGYGDRVRKLKGENEAKLKSVKAHLLLTLCNQGNAFRALKKYEGGQGAKSCYEEALRIDPTYIFALYNYGATYYDLKDYKKALECYTKVLESPDLNKKDSLCDKADVLCNKGIVLRDSNLISEQQVLEYFNEAIRLNPNHADSWYEKGKTLEKKMKCIKEAFECYQKASEIAPEHGAAQAAALENFHGNSVGRCKK